jgi:crotonobetainyl-CoA:carnitine CoA-transferase CaiB-like acyl-CoA transferase
MSPPLSGVVVVDLSSGIAGAYATKLLADGGAEVIKVEAPEGDPLRRWTASGADLGADLGAGPSGGADGALFTFLSSSKQSRVAEPDDETDLERVRELLADADAVVWSRGSRLAEHPSLTPAAIRSVAPHLTVTSITPFGLDGPWSEHPATELTLQAWSGGIVGLGRGSADRPPVFVGGQVGQWLAGTYAAIGTMVSLTRTRADGQGELVDLSVLETLALCLTYYPVTYADMVGRPFRTGRSIVTPGVEATSDGLVGVGVGTGQQWLDFCALVEHPEWTEDRKLFANRGHLRPEIAAWMAERTTAEVLELTAAFRIPHAPIGTGASIPVTDHFVARGSIVRNAGGAFDEPARPFRFDPPLLRPPTPAPRLGQHTPIASRAGRRDVQEPAQILPELDGAGADGLPFEGVRVLDLTAFWAGPLCTHVLAMLGAEVLHIESTARPDGTRLLAGLRFSEPDWWEQSGIFSGLNTNKSSVTLDLATDRGRELLRELLATCDVLVENYTPRVLEQIGLDIDAVRAERPDLVVVRMPGFGLDGPWRDDPAFAFVIEDAAGLTWLTGHPDENPVSPYCVGDSNAGLHAVSGLLLALEHRRRTGEGVLVEAPMVDAALNIAAEQVVEHSAYGTLLQRDGNRGPAAAPQGLYLSAEVDEAGNRDAWVAIAVADQDQWLGLRAALGHPSWATDPVLATSTGRRAHHDTIDGHLSTWCAERSGDEIVERLWAAGVPVGKVLQPHEQGALEQLQHRGFFEAVDHPVTGPARHATLPMRFSRGPERRHRRRAPLLGEHTDEVLRGIGVTDEELAELQADDVIGRAPRAGR